ncbi:uncharacterized protein LOC144548681 isoform X2 [Carex rostrata]
MGKRRKHVILTYVYINISFSSFSFLTYFHLYTGFEIGAMGENNVIVMAGFTAAAVAVAFGMSLRQRTRKPKVSVGENMGLNLICESEESRIVVSETSQDQQEEACSVIFQPRSEAFLTDTADDNYEQLEKNLVELKEKEKAKEKEEFERLNCCMKDLEARIMKLSLQEAEIIELKRRVLVDEEKIEKLNLQEVEIMKMKEKIENDENQIQRLQEEVAMLRDNNNNNKNKKKHWPWNKDASVHDAIVSVHGKNNKKK